MNKGNKIIYWITTSLLAIGMLQSGIFAILKSKEWVEIVTGLGYPEYFLILLGVWKILGVITILIPKFPLLKEWAYAGFFFAMSGALISHLAVGDFAIKSIAGPTFQILFIILSWYFRPVNRKIISNSKTHKNA
ncbi:DoxX-like family protein [Zhouia amylolytica]|uniref:DoxX-like family protein n=1 Tax=Zhouia amylolytica TaxID=376730 RepID=A0A1I6U4R9_9FLAO|nr:DoxX family protein [Zhouia amylolytica]SFS96453.1 DoxX-like family protein [Zhouia amylolytica]